MTKFIIVKYHRDFFDGRAFVHNSIFKTYSANQAGIDKEIYNSKEEAEIDLVKYNKHNPSVDAGIVELEEI